MAARKANTRPLVVDGRAYRWRVRARATYDQAVYAEPLTFTVQADDGGSALVVTPGGPRPDNWPGRRGVVVTLVVATAAVRRALAAGWRPGEPGPAFRLNDSAPPDADPPGSLGNSPA